MTYRVGETIAGAERRINEQLSSNTKLILRTTFAGVVGAFGIPGTMLLRDHLTESNVSRAMASGVEMGGLILSGTVLLSCIATVFYYLALARTDTLKLAEIAKLSKSHGDNFVPFPERPNHNMK